MAESDTEFVKQARENLKSYDGLILRLGNMKKDLDAACDRIEGQQRLITEFIAKAEETLK